MYNIFNQVLDHYDERLLNAKLADELPERPTDEKDFALVLKAGEKIACKYPINNLENAIYSYVSYKKNAYKLPEDICKIAEANLGKILMFYGVPNELTIDDTVKTNSIEVTSKDNLKVASGEIKNYFAVETDDLQYLPLDTELDFKESLNEFTRNSKYLPVKLKKTAAGNFIQRSKDLNIPVPSNFENYASFTLADTGTIKMAMASRFTIYPEPIKKLASDVLSSIKTANDALNAIEKIQNIDRKVGVVEEKHFDLADKFFKKADTELEDKLTEAIDSNKFDGLLDNEVIGVLKDNGVSAFENFNPRLKTVILNIIK